MQFRIWQKVKWGNPNTKHPDLQFCSLHPLQTTFQFTNLFLCRTSFSFTCTWSKNTHLYVLFKDIGQSQKWICIKITFQSTFCSHVYVKLKLPHVLPTIDFYLTAPACLRCVPFQIYGCTLSSGGNSPLMTNLHLKCSHLQHFICAEHK